MLGSGPARDKFALEGVAILRGRFDSGVTVSDAPLRISVLEDDQPGSFLGFDVSDLDIIAFDRPRTSPGHASHIPTSEPGHIGNEARFN